MIRMIRRSYRFQLMSMALCAACGGPTRHDIYLEATQRELQAREGPCRLLYDENSQAHAISGDQIQSCLSNMEEVLTSYEQAHLSEPENMNIRRVVERVQDEVHRLRSMLTQVRRIERERDAQTPR